MFFCGRMVSPPRAASWRAPGVSFALPDKIAALPLRQLTYSRCARRGRALLTNRVTVHMAKMYNVSHKTIRLADCRKESFQMARTVMAAFVVVPVL
jgi:hypothetical protein